MLASGIAAACLLTFSQPPVAQGAAYHQMVDSRTLLGVPHALNVLSNFPFAIVGVLGLLEVERARRTFGQPSERWPYLVLFVGMILTALGSGYYHLSPGNARLVWDRLPMTLAFMGLLASVFSERVSARAGTALLAPLVALGIGSVLYWHWTEMAGAGDLRPYILVQFGSLFLVVLLLLLYSPRYHGTRYVVAGLLLYGVAKLAEIADRWMFEFSGMLSGHTLKHLAAAAAIGCLVIMLRERARVRGGGEIERHGSLNMA